MTPATTEPLSSRDMPPVISESKSDFLNLIRWLAALLVVLGHVDMYLQQLGGSVSLNSFGYAGMHSHAAVMIFFVLSGYVVAFATERKSELDGYGFREYFLDRWSRIYSVLFSAIAFTLILDFIGKRLSPAFYANPEFLPQNSFALRLFANLFSLQGVQGYRIQLGSNPALWSIGYEFTFYLLFGLAYFRRKLFSGLWVAPVLFATALVAIGWKMAAYFGIWLLGVCAFHVSRSSHLTAIKLHPVVLLALLAFANHVIVHLNALALPELLQDVLFASVVAVALAFDTRPQRLWERARAINTYMADYSYSIYAFHMPLIFLLCSLFVAGVFQQLSWPPLPGIVLTMACLAIGRCFYIFAESRRAAYRRVGDRVLGILGL